MGCGMGWDSVDEDRIQTGLGGLLRPWIDLDRAAMGEAEQGREKERAAGLVDCWIGFIEKP